MDIQILLYFPSPLEFGVLMGVFGFGMFLLLMGLRYLPLAPVSKSTRVSV